LFDFTSDLCLFYGKISSLFFYPLDPDLSGVELPYKNTGTKKMFLWFGSSISTNTCTGKLMVPLLLYFIL